MGDMSNYPERQVTTKVGEVRVVLHSATTGVVVVGPQPGTDDHDNLPVAVVNGIPHAGRIFIERDLPENDENWPGGWRPRNFFVKRLDRNMLHNDPTDKARMAFYAAVKEAMAVVIKNGEMMTDGKIAGLRAERQSKLAAIAKLRADIEIAEREVRVLDSRIEAAQSPQSFSPGAAFDAQIEEVSK